MGHPGTMGGPHILVEYSLIIIMDPLAKGYKNERGDKQGRTQDFKPGGGQR